MIIVFLFASSCARDVYVNYQAEAANTSKVVFKYPKISHKARVIVNDSVIFTDQKVKSFTIKNLPAGDYKFKYSSSSGLYKAMLSDSAYIKLEGNGETIVKSADLPINNTWYWVGVSSLAIWPLALIAAFAL